MKFEEKNNYQLNGNPLTEIEGTPFHIVEMENAMMLVMGRDVLKIGETEKELREYVKNKPWELILNAGAIYNKYINEKIKEDTK